MDLLARICPHRLVGSGQPVLHGLPIHASTRSRPETPLSAVSLAGGAALQVDGCWRSHHISLGV